MSNTEQSPESTFQLPSPGPEHELLKPFAGSFRATVKMWMGPGEPNVSTGQMKNSFQLNGLYLHQEYVGDANDGPFPSFAGKGYWGYNQSQQQFEGFWIDIASTTMQTETGQVDESGKIWTMKSEVEIPGMGPMKKRTVITLTDADHHSMESFFTTPDGNEMKQMEINYERAD